MTAKNKNTNENTKPHIRKNNLEFPPLFSEEKILEEIETETATETTPEIIAEENPFETPGYEQAEPGEGP